MKALFPLLTLALVGCPGSNSRAIGEGYEAYADVPNMGPRIWEGRSAGRKGLRQTLATESNGFGAPGRMDVVVAEYGDLDETMASMVGERSLLRVDVTGPDPVVQSVAIPIERSEVLEQYLGGDTTRILHTGTEASAIATGRLDGQLREGALALYRSGSWEVYDIATEELRTVGDQLVLDTIEGLRLRSGSDWLPVPGDALGPASEAGFITLSFAPGQMTVDWLDWTGAVIDRQTVAISAERTLWPVGVIDNGTPDDFVAVLSDCDVPIGELWRFEGAAIAPVRPSRLGPLQPSRSEAVLALDSFNRLPGETAFREVRAGALAPWIDSRVFWGHGDEWGCPAPLEADDSLPRCKPRPVTSPARPDPGADQVAVVSIDQTDSHPRVHLRQQALPWAVDLTADAACDDSRCVDVDDPNNPNTECARTTLDPNNYTCVPPGTVPPGERFFDGLPFAETPLAATLEPADLDDEPVFVDPLVCGFVSTIQPPGDYEAEVHGITELTLSSPGYSSVVVQSDPDWLDGGEVILNRGETVGPIDEPFYAYASPTLMVVASENQFWSYSAFSDEWRPVVNVDPALPLDIRTLGPFTMLRNIDDETWYLDGADFRKLSNDPIDFGTVDVSNSVWWLSFDSGRGTRVHNRGTTPYVWPWTSAGPATHHDTSYDGECLTRTLDDGSVNWHKNKPAKTETILPAGWFKPGNRVKTLVRFNSVNPSPVTLVEPTVAQTDDGDCFTRPGGCTLTYLYAGRRTPLSTDAIAFAKGGIAAVWVDSSGVHRGTDGSIETDARFGRVDVAAGMLDLIAECRGTRCGVWRTDTWPMTEVVSWDDGETKTLTASEFRTFTFTSSTRTIRYDAVTRDLTVLGGASERLMANGAGYTWREGYGAFHTPSDSEAVFARGDVLFPATDELSYPACIPFSQRRFVDGVADGRELLCAKPPTP